MAPQAERVFLNEGNVLVTNTRVVIGGQTFALANITSVKLARDPEPGNALGLFIIFAGLALSFFVVVKSESCGASLIVALMACLSASAAALLLNRKMVVIVSAGSEFKALKTRDNGFMARVADAISNAIVARG